MATLKELSDATDRLNRTEPTSGAWQLTHEMSGHWVLARDGSRVEIGETKALALHALEAFRLGYVQGAAMRELVDHGG